MISLIFCLFSIFTLCLLSQSLSEPEVNNCLKKFHSFHLFPNIGIGTCSSVEEVPEMDFIKELDSEDQFQTKDSSNEEGEANVSEGEYHEYRKRKSSSEDENGDFDDFSFMRAERGKSSAKSSKRDKTMDMVNGLRLDCLVQDSDDSDDDSYDSSQEGPPPYSSVSKPSMFPAPPEAEEEPEEPVPGFRMYMQEKVHLLPIPSALKNFILFYRT